MKKKLYATALTVGAAAALIAGNGAFSAFAFANDTAPDVKITGQHQQSEFEGEVAPAIKAPGFSAAPEKTNEDMSEDKAVNIAKEALEEKFDVSLDGMKPFPVFCAREDMEGTFYFVSFTDAEAVIATRAVALKGEGIVPQESTQVKVAGKNDNADIYIAFVNSKTGEVVSLEKNPSAPSDTVEPSAPADPAN